ncbi:Na+/H+ antiporter subunit G [Paracoccus sp. M683]|uniref:Na+/H+ antiporter subunit G n=1 Tax=Paracoccus sp. M683 TaxID=2594268 RepID=UPI00117EFB7A|nr:Na+/H+ antiporter subunit G [Paracoccus sp. M683]TRW99122.1 Na+/H+ antiporter subunit G [Paracoccus sp. M683]
MEQFAEILIAALIVIGGTFGLIGSYGLVKLPDPMTRLHAPTKAATVGVGSVLVASILWFAIYGEHDSWHELLIILFIFLTAPITGLMIAKSHIHRSWRWNELPTPAPDDNWATCAPDREAGTAAKSEDQGQPG